ncbi:vesicular-fusion protein nsf [Tritrichomonas foetus]|uniref:Vesicle-fusing ATPase n=1 Tax=Tritrichomonas foetus TaxID=1144522 RepID=A0A1J4JAN7_9EUKA|nr:vesicular-fusion protein nsf [Tritrichomonas foetus]|eukprot:OHS96238.1 vesicular-fusion protein nsf [Tritrichomonas foetus]
MVGESERKIRELFADAEADQAQNGDNSQLHLIIFDEFDSICKKRGGAGTLQGIQDTLVNQLLSKIDGVNSLDNVLLIGMTNRRDLIDEALLRPGRLEVQLMISLPDEAGREQIFGIHTKKLRESGGMADDVDIKELASLTPNYTGAEIEGVVKSAQSYSLSNGFDPKTLQLKDAADLKVTRQHFMLALQEVRPAFGVEEDVAKLCPRGIVDFSKGFRHLKKHVSRFVDSLLNSDTTSLMSFCVSGMPGSGLTAFAVNVATAGFTYVKLLLAKNFIGRTEDQVANEILQTFQNAYKSKASAIVIDDLDAIIEFSPIGPRFTNKILQSILVLLKQPPPSGSKLAIFTTTSKREAMEMIGVDQRYFYEELTLEPITQADQLKKIAKDACNVELKMSHEEEEEASDYLLQNRIPIKRAIESIDFAAFEAKGEAVKWSHLYKSLKQHIHT